MSVGPLDQDACCRRTHECRRVTGPPDPLVEKRRERVSEWGRIEVEVDDDLTRVFFEESDAMGRDTGLGTCVGEAVEGRLPCRVVGDCVFDVQGCGHDSRVARVARVEHPRLLGFWPGRAFPTLIGCPVTPF